MSEYEQRLDAFSRRLHDLEHELEELRRTAATPAATVERPRTPVPPATLDSAAARRVESSIEAIRKRHAQLPPKAPPAPRAPSAPPREFPPAPAREPFDLSSLL